MRRDPAFDPPEYADWSPDEDLVDAYARAVRGNPERAPLVAGLRTETLLGFYGDLLRTRLLDRTLIRWVREGVLPQAWLATGEEAVTVGAAAAVEPGLDVVLPTIRDAGAFPMMGVSLTDVLRGFLATADSPNGGRDIHVGDPELGLLQPTTRPGTNVPITAGAALAVRLQGRSAVALTWVGDGATSTAAFHEGINFAAVQDLPLVVLLRDHQVATEMSSEPRASGDLARTPAAYGIPSSSCDGNNVLDVWAATRLAVERCRRGEGPACVVAATFPMAGDPGRGEARARGKPSPEMLAHWGRRDPIGMYESWLLGNGSGAQDLQEVEEAVLAEVEAAEDEALGSRDRRPEPASSLYDGVSEGGTLVGLEGRPV